MEGQTWFCFVEVRQVNKQQQTKQKWCDNDGFRVGKCPQERDIAVTVLLYGWMLLTEETIRIGSISKERDNREDGFRGSRCCRVIEDQTVGC